ncbi:MAG: 50S ribosome-binding GTPase [Candidatus Lokiarchaeota archaeon]|nr:50S ribosome-binding GTPase [Candidatus Lokiarchaeota archaeon]
MIDTKSDDSKENQVKILLMGLDNSGKTSILTCLKGIKKISVFNALRPTRGADWDNFKNLNRSYVIVDLGGQETFRDGYMNDFTVILAGASKIIYVIDIQDTNRYDEALEYLNRVIHQIPNPNDIDFSIFLHKFDSDFKSNENDIDQLIRKIKQVTPPNFNYSLHKTAIYATFEKTMIT